MATLNMEATPDTVWALLQEVGRRQEENAIEIRETERLMKELSLEADKRNQEADKRNQEADKRHQETEKQFKETDKQFKETDKKIQKLGEKIDELSTNIGGVNNRLGDIAEGLLTTDLLKKFKALGLDFDDALQNIKIRERGTKRVLAEIDCLLINTTIALVGEVKACLTKGDVEKHINRMKILSSKQNGLLGGKKLYGAVAGVKIQEGTKDFAKGKGLFVLEPSGDTVKIEVPIKGPTVW